MKKIIFPALLFTVIMARLCFSAYTNYTAEDAHITFQFVRNIARGDGFSLNPGEPIYGTTTPLLTLLLTVWSFFSENIVLGTRIIAVLSIGFGVWFLWKSIGNWLLGIAVLLPYALSGKMIVEEMQGMEMPLVFLFSMMAWYFWVRKHPAGVGIAAGLLLWTRIDAVVFVGCLFIVMAFTDYGFVFRSGAWATAVYLPWVIFAWLYFGSPVPFTIIAKQVAYGIGNPSYLVHFSRIYEYLSPLLFFITVIGVYFSFVNRKFILFGLFFVIEVIHLILTGTTFFSRYFYLLTVSSFVLSGLAIYVLFQKWKFILVIATIGLSAYSAIGNKDLALSTKALQDVRHGTLVEMGTWLNQNTPAGATVLLEPLGYVGWYADRIMYDEVGLVTPLAVELHREKINGVEFHRYFSPDYVILSCGQKIDPEMRENYRIASIFDGRASRSCYEVWEHAEELIERYVR